MNIFVIATQCSIREMNVQEGILLSSRHVLLLLGADFLVLSADLYCVVRKMTQQIFYWPTATTTNAALSTQRVLYFSK